ncbi:unnamed protein product [Ranitomeya imitator]|uniref:Single-pass membrane and coiled-coil domain-containing protein 4 n=1 Tax=Ranitomeya imitator TaxID=111125 RepID=A0ABN9LTI4_9NEOB|nr:unnamed protein product [Ranitomeya imitator]
MRQLKGKPKKESNKDKKERKQAMQEARQQITTVVLPTIAIVMVLIVVFVYVATRPNTIEGLSVDIIMLRESVQAGPSCRFCKPVLLKLGAEVPRKPLPLE